MAMNNNSAQFINIDSGVYDNTMKCPFCDFTYEDRADNSFAENTENSEHNCTEHKMNNPTPSAEIVEKWRAEFHGIMKAKYPHLDTRQSALGKYLYLGTENIWQGFLMRALTESNLAAELRGRIAKLQSSLNAEELANHAHERRSQY